MSVPRTLLAATTLVVATGALLGAASPARSVDVTRMPVNGVDVGLLPGGTFSRATDVNQFGEVTGYADTADGETHAFLWRRGQMRDLGTLGGDNSYGARINGSGLVVGSAETAGGVRHAAYWPEGGAAHDLGGLGGGLSLATGVNEQGTIVGYGATDAAHQQFRPFVWKANRRSLLPTLGENGFATDVNSNDWITGGSRRTASAPTQAVYWDAQRAIHPLRALAAAPGGYALGIDDQSLVFGYSDTGSGLRATYWKAKKAFAVPGLGATGSKVARSGGRGWALAVRDTGAERVLSAYAVRAKASFSFDFPFNRMPELAAFPDGFDQAALRVLDGRPATAQALLAFPSLRGFGDTAPVHGVVAVGHLGTLPSDVTSQVQVTSGPLTSGAAPHIFAQTVTIRNTSTSAVRAPVVLGVQDLDPRVTVINRTGATFFYGEFGTETVQLPLLGDRLNAGGVVRIQLQFRAPAGVTIQYNPVVLGAPAG